MFDGDDLVKCPECKTWRSVYETCNHCGLLPLSPRPLKPGMTRRKACQVLGYGSSIITVSGFLKDCVQFAGKHLAPKPVAVLPPIIDNSSNDIAVILRWHKHQQDAQYGAILADALFEPVTVPRWHPGMPYQSYPSQHHLHG